LWFGNIRGSGPPAFPIFAGQSRVNAQNRDLNPVFMTRPAPPAAQTQRCLAASEVSRRLILIKGVKCTLINAHYSSPPLAANNGSSQPDLRLNDLRIRVKGTKKNTLERIFCRLVPCHGRNRHTATWTASQPRDWPTMYSARYLTAQTLCFVQKAFLSSAVLTSASSPFMLHP